MSRLPHRVRAACLILGGLVLLFTAACYVREPDACAAVTIWPPWAWTVPGVLLTLLGCRRCSRRVIVGMMCLWLTYLVVLCEEPKSILLGPVRSRLASRVPRSKVLRVVSLNCAVGSVAAAREAASYRPDVVLLQESPSRRDVEALGQSLYGKRACVAWSADTSVVVGGTIVELGSNHKMPACANALRVRLKGKEVLLMSVRLRPPQFGADYSASGYCRGQAAARRTHRRELSEVALWLERQGRIPTVIGGDFNAPGWDGAMSELPNVMHDPFREAGIGCGNTVLNDLPVLRFDQIWVSREFRGIKVRACRTQNSDHRLVVCDLQLTH